MSQQDRVTIARFTMEHEARVAAEELESAGITAYLADTESGTTFGTYVGTAFGGVRLQVAGEDAQRAGEILGEEAEADSVDWTCPHCSTEVDAGFGLCWNCGAEQDRSDSSEVKDENLDASPNGELSGSQSDSKSDRPLGSEPTEDELAENDALAAKALRSAIFMFVFAPILLMTAWLIVRLTTLPLSSRGTRRFYLAWFFTLIFVATYSMIFGAMPGSF